MSSLPTLPIQIMGWAEISFEIERATVMMKTVYDTSLSTKQGSRNYEFFYPIVAVSCNHHVWYLVSHTAFKKGLN